jgi:hypothetical protein
MERVFKATGARVQTTVNNLDPAVLGTCAEFEEKQVCVCGGGGDEWVGNGSQRYWCCTLNHLLHCTQMVGTVFLPDLPQTRLATRSGHVTAGCWGTRSLAMVTWHGSYRACACAGWR